MIVDYKSEPKYVMCINRVKYISRVRYRRTMTKGSTYWTILNTRYNTAALFAGSAIGVQAVSTRYSGSVVVHSFG